MVPWLTVEEQSIVFPDHLTFSRPEQQEQHVKEVSITLYAEQHFTVHCIALRMNHQQCVQLNIIGNYYNRHPILKFCTATAIFAIAVLDHPYPTLYPSISGNSLALGSHVRTEISYPASHRPTLHPPVAVHVFRIGRLLITIT